MEPQYDFGMIGIGVMGSNLLLNIADHGYAVIGFDINPERGQALEKAAKTGTNVKGTSDMGEMVTGLKKPRKMMMLVPAGKPVDDVINKLLPYLEDGDIVIDGGNSYYKDTLRRITYLQDKGIHFFGMGISGGELGARLGPSMMPGGDKDAYQYLKPILEAVAAKFDNVPCVAYMGNGAAGHYVKMVHNGIEYAIMQIISEVYDLLHRGAGFNNPALHQIFLEWDKAELQSYLIEITAEIFKTLDHETEKFLVDLVLDQAGSKGTGKWTSQDAMDLPVSIPTIDMAVAMRDLSVFKEDRVKAAQLYQTKTGKITNGEQELVNLSEDTLFFCMAMAYVQGLSMLAKASKELSLETSMQDVVKVWRAGCIIRSAMLDHFSKAFQKDPQLDNLLLDKDMAALLQQKEKNVRKLISIGIDAKIPMAAISSALAYFDAFCSDRMPTNLIQAQRDFFGAHTYQRIDKPGVFHTEWHV